MSRKKPGRDFYEVLEISKDASPKEIKKARRKKAAQSHPDLGGNHDEMAEVNHAYDVLINPERRRLYDATGTDQKEKPLDDEVSSLILMVFQEALHSDSPQMLKRAVSLVEANLKKAQLQRQEYQQRLDKLRAKRGLITVKEGDNLFVNLLDQESRQVEIAMNSCARGEIVCKAALKALQQYESAEPNIPVRGQMDGHLISKLFDDYRSNPFPGWR
jgi:DnaJ domain